MFIVYRIIGKGIIKAMNVSTGAVPRYLVKGSELKNDCAVDTQHTRSHLPYQKSRQNLGVQRRKLKSNIIYQYG
jgi:hypothetical protein